MIESCLFSFGCNFYFSKEEIEIILLECFGVEKVIWFFYGIY